MIDIYTFLLKIFKTKENLSYNLKLAFFLCAILSFLSFDFLFIIYNQYYVLTKHSQEILKFENLDQAKNFINSKLTEDFYLILFISVLIGLPIAYYLFELVDLTRNKTEILSEKEVLLNVKFIGSATLLCLANAYLMNNFISINNTILGFISYYYSSLSPSFLS